MTDYDEAVKAAAYAELDRLTAEFKEAESLLDDRRKALHEAIVRHLRERNAPPGELADHTPYDRNHVGRLRAAAEVPALRAPTVKPAKRARKKPGV